MNNESIKRALSFDALHEAEKITGLSYKEDEATSNLGMILHLVATEDRRNLMKKTRDSYYGQSMEEFLEIVNELGFVQVLSDKIQDTENDTYSIYWRDGIVLTVESYNGKTVNMAKMYFNYAYGDDDRDGLSSCSGSAVENPEFGKVWYGDKDVRIGFRYHLNNMEQHGKFLSQWVKRPWLWFVNYGETKTKDYDYEGITNARIARLPVEIQKAIPKDK